MSWRRDDSFDAPASPPEPYPPYPIDDFLKVPRDAIRQVVARAQTQESIVGMIALAAMSAATQQLIDVQMPRNLLRPVSLYLYGRLGSSDRKTSAAELLLKCFKDFDERVEADYRLAKQTFERDIRLWRNVERGLSRKIQADVAAGRSSEALLEQYAAHLAKEPRAPRQRKFLRENISERALYEALAGQRESIAALADEGDTVAGGGLLDRLGVIDSIWNGRLPERDRGYGKLSAAVDPRLTLLILLPSSIADHHEKKRGSLARDIGFHGRNLQADPPSNAGFRTQEAIDPEDRSIDEFTDCIVKFLEKSHFEHSEGRLQPQKVYFSEDAVDAWERKSAEIEECLKPGGSLHQIKDFAGKALEIASRIAAIFHYFSGQVGDITLDTFARAWRVVEWHMSEFKRIFYERSAERQVEINTEKLMSWLRQQARYGSKKLYRNDIVRRNPLRPLAALQPAFEALLLKGAIDVRMEDGSWMVHLDPRHFPELDPPKLFVPASRGQW